MKNSVFYKIYFSVVIVFCVSLVLGLFCFNGFLKNFEANQPDKIATRIIENHLKTNGIRELQKEYNLSLSDYETDQSIQSFYDTNIKDKSLSFSGLSLKPEGVEVAYEILADGEKVFELHLNRNDNGKFYVSQTKINQNLLKSYTVKTNQNTEIYINGILVKAEHRKNAEPTEIVKKMCESQEIINKQTIDIDNMLYEPQSVVSVFDNNETKLTLTEKSYISEQSFPEKQKIEQLAKDGSSAYAAYMLNVVSIGSLNSYFDTSSEFYKKLRSTAVQFTLDNVKNNVQQFKMDDVHKYNDKLYSCHVSFINNLTLGKKEYKDYFDKYVYIALTDKGYKIVDMQNVE